MQRQAGNLAAHGVETADDDGVGRVVDNNFHAGQAFQGTDIAALASNDAAFYLLVLEVEHAHRVLDGILGGGALDGLDDNLLGLFVGGDFGLLHNVHDIACCLRLGFVGHHFNEVLLGLVGGHAGDVFQFLDAFVVHLLHFGLPFAQYLYLAVQVLAHLFQLVALLL